MRFKDLYFYALIVLGVAAWPGYIVWTFIPMVHLLQVWENKVQQTQTLLVWENKVKQTQTLLVKLCKWLSSTREKRCSAVANTRERAIMGMVGRSLVLL